MPNDPKESSSSRASGNTGEVVLHSPGEVNVKLEDLPAKPVDDKKIHPRRPLPLVPQKSDDAVDDPPSEKP
jgi:hypothetical protein